MTEDIYRSYFLLILGCEYLKQKRTEREKDYMKFAIGSVLH